MATKFRRRRHFLRFSTPPWEQLPHPTVQRTLSPWSLEAWLLVPCHSGSLSRCLNSCTFSTFLQSELIHMHCSEMNCGCDTFISQFISRRSSQWVDSAITVGACWHYDVFLRRKWRSGSASLSSMRGPFCGLAQMNVVPLRWKSF